MSAVGRAGVAGALTIATDLGTSVKGRGMVIGSGNSVVSASGRTESHRRRQAEQTEEKKSHRSISNKSRGIEKDAQRVFEETMGLSDRSGL